ncbi:MAG: energy-coupling factor transporter transmembrane protein EcfT [Anaerolineae bacterium]|nr:energy-coupling factor transporter transmembrane protein EcfT [Anaerolineae bacterium]
MAEYHTLAWVAWLAAAALPALLTRNPYYLALVIMAAAVVYAEQGDRSPAARGWSAFIKLGLILCAFSVPANALFVHYGDVGLFSLPRSWPVVGGRITLEAALFGLGNGLSLLALLLVFAVFNIAVPPAALLRLVPDFLHQAGVTVAIAIAFVPQMIASVQEIREAQQVRGHRFRGLRDLLPLFVPLLASGLERAIQLAESMEARGFGNTQQGALAVRLVIARVASVAGLLGLALGAFVYAYFPGRRAPGAAALVVSVALLLASFWLMGRSVQRSHYRRWLWRRRDTLLALTGGAVTLFILALWILDRPALIYYPYPPLSPWPMFRLEVGVALSLLVLPALLAPERKPVVSEPLSSTIPATDTRHTAAGNQPEEASYGTVRPSAQGPGRPAA